MQECIVKTTLQLPGGEIPQQTPASIHVTRERVVIFLDSLPDYYREWLVNYGPKHLMALSFHLNTAVPLAKAPKPEVFEVKKTESLAEYVSKVLLERQHQIDLGYTADHDRDMGLSHLIDIQSRYISQGDAIKAHAMALAINEAFG